MLGFPSTETRKHMEDGARSDHAQNHLILPIESLFGRGTDNGAL